MKLITKKNDFIAENLQSKNTNNQRIYNVIQEPSNS